MAEGPAIDVDVQKALRASTLFADFTPVGLKIVAEAVERRSVGRGTYAFRGGDAATGLSVIAHGTLHLLPREGGPVLAEIGPGDSLGGFSLLGGGEHLLSAYAATDVELVTLSHKRFEELREKKPGASIKLMLALAKDFADRIREAKGPLREFLSWQIGKRQAESGR
jgi:CRP/FNR family transcriptional regulator, cyclic AMP receptor protein